MSQTNVIVLRIARDRAREFEALFEREQYPNWRKHKASGGFLSASLTRIEFGSEQDDAQRGRYVNYVVVAVVRDMDAHTAHDDDPAFKAYDEKAEAFQPEGPSVWGGTTLFEI
jgi:hypothetical protein